MNTEKLNICGIEIDKVNYDELIRKINTHVSQKTKLTIGYANANVINICSSDKNTANIISSYDIIHPDGIGVQLAFKYIYGKNAPNLRFTGSDFYPLLAEKAISEKWRVFFFGHDYSTLEKVKVKYPELIIAGFQNGYNYNNNILVQVINLSNADILIVGLGSVTQDKWINENKNIINTPVIIAVGDGIKIFAGTKVRGPKLIRKLGLEWLIRTLRFPHMYAKRYLIGNPLFLYRIIKFKMSKLDK